MRAALIDLTRLVSRLGREALTGVDRVELAWLDHLLERTSREGGPLFALVRTAWGFVLLDGRGAQRVAQLVHSRAALPPADLVSRISRRGDGLRARAETQIRLWAMARCPVPGLAQMLASHMPTDTICFNTGHANLTSRVMAALPGPAVVLLHDTIPLDHPEFCREGIPEVFRRKLDTVSARADLVIHTAAATRKASEAQLRACGRVPPGVIAPLGVAPAQPGGFRLPGLDLGRPWFVTLGTIEPRKNHMLLLDLWQNLARQTPADRLPQLVIAGSRGWRNQQVFRRLDARPPGIIEAPGLVDTAIAGILAGSQGLLFPSFAEGFGLPPLEAAALRVPVLASDLEVLRELLGDYPVYLDPRTPYSWQMPVTALAGSAAAGQHFPPRRNPVLPDWETHFQVVWRKLGEMRIPPRRGATKNWAS